MLTAEKYWALLGASIFRGLTESEEQEMAEFEIAFPREAELMRTRMAPDEELDDEPEEKNPFHVYHRLRAKYATDEPMEMEPTNGAPETREQKNLTLLDHLRRLAKPDDGE